MFDAIYRPGVALGSYPEKKYVKRAPFESFVDAALRRIRPRAANGTADGEKFVEDVKAFSLSFNELNEADFQARCIDLRLSLQHKGYDPQLTAQAFAAVREASGRLLGKRHFPTQLLGGWALLKGHVAEMQTGEGKTITTLLPACTAAMAGVPVHVITANDYLAARDAETLIPVFEWFGLTVGVINDEVSDPAARKAAYDCHVLYCSPSQVAFDYLRDRMTMGDRRDRLDHKIRALTDNANEKSPLLMRGLCFAIVDEADSVLIDDASTPLILSQQSGEPPPPEPYVWGLDIVRELSAETEIEVNSKYRDGP